MILMSMQNQSGMACGKCSKVQKDIAYYENLLKDREFVEGNILLKKEVDNFQYLQKFSKYIMDNKLENLARYLKRMDVLLCQNMGNCDICSSPI